MLEDRFENYWHFLISSEDFRQFPKISKKFQKCWKVILSNLQQISENFSKDIGKLPMISEDFIKKFKMLASCLEHFATFAIFFLKISKDFRRFSKILEICCNVCFCTFWCFFLSFPKNFQISNHMFFLVQFKINLHSWFFQKVQI